MSRKPPHQKQPSKNLQAVNNNILPFEPQQGARTVSYLYQGQLPPASELERYEQLCQGTADRLIKMHESKLEMDKTEQAFAHKYMPLWREQENNTHIRFQNLGFIGLFLCLLCASFFMYIAQGWAEKAIAGIFLSAPLIALLRSFKR